MLRPRVTFDLSEIELSIVTCLGGESSAVQMRCTGLEIEVFQALCSVY
jgi:hypothetical protein